MLWFVSICESQRELPANEVRNGLLLILSFHRMRTNREKSSRQSTFFQLATCVNPWYSPQHAIQDSERFTGILFRYSLRGETLVQEHLIEMSVGETIQVGQYSVTLLDVNGDELCVEINGDDRDDWTLEECFADETLEVV